MLFRSAVDNWRLAVSAAAGITGSTGDLLSLYGDLSGNGGGASIFTDGAIDLARLEDLPARVTATSDALDAAAADLTAIRAATSPASALDRVRDKALSEMEPVQQAVGQRDEVGAAQLLDVAAAGRLEWVQAREGHFFRAQACRGKSRATSPARPRPTPTAA